MRLGYGSDFFHRLLHLLGERRGLCCTVLRSFQGVRVEALLHSVYNRLLERIPEGVRSLHSLEYEPTANVGRSGQFVTEADLEDQVIDPLLPANHQEIGRADERTRTAFLLQLRVITQALQGLPGAANHALLGWFLFCGLPSVASHCAPGGIRSVSGRAAATV